MKPTLLDLFCGQGGAAMGYYNSGFNIIGIDIQPQPLYPFPMITADALTLPINLNKIDAIHASPPCQRYSDLAYRNGNADIYPDLIEPIRQILETTNKPYVIENVERSPLNDPIMLCGTMFENLRVIRHRLFETNWPIQTHQLQHATKHPLVFTHDKRKKHYGKLDQNTSYVQVTGGGNCTIENARSAMGIDWADKNGLNEAIPPAYTEFIGKQLIQQI